MTSFALERMHGLTEEVRMRLGKDGMKKLLTGFRAPDKEMNVARLDW